MPVRKLTSMERVGDYATLRFYKEYTVIRGDEESLVNVEQTGWIRVPVREIGTQLLDYDVYELWTEEDIAVHRSMVEAAHGTMGTNAPQETTDDD